MTFEEYTRFITPQNEALPIVRSLFWHTFGVTSIHKNFETICDIVGEADKAIYANDTETLAENLACIVYLVFRIADRAGISMPEVICRDLKERGLLQQ